MFEEDQDGQEQHQDVLNREREAVEALDRCLTAGANPEDLQTLARECGVKWKPDAHADSAALG